VAIAAFAVGLGWFGSQFQTHAAQQTEVLRAGGGALAQGRQQVRHSENQIHVDHEHADEPRRTTSVGY
jgi:hypothetical protein